ncbi:MAG: membrane protein insertase YidC [Rhodospirillaceae bacterium]|nr:membrane protein insertase YidC [Rhodospirillaceae bacterium]|tara:strand:- start:712 stop:2475 length:1764 start_codon:yes stop_codon:yes gene_type:complete
MQPDQKNIWLAMAIIVLMFVGWQFFYELPRIQQEQEALERQQQLAAEQGGDPTLPELSGVEGLEDAQAEANFPDVQLTRGEALALSERITIDTPSLHGSIALTGGRIDDLTLVKYHERVDPDSPEVVLLSPANGPSPYFVEFGWLAEESGVVVPDNSSVWQASGSTLTPDTPVTMTWDNGQGLTFERTLSVDDQYMFTVNQSVTNSGGAAVTLFPYGLINRHNTPEILGFYILHEGLIGVLNETLEEVDYDDLNDLEEPNPITYDSTNGWLGITDKYWQTALIPDQGDSFKGRFLHNLRNGTIDTYQADYLRSAVTVDPGATASTEDLLFAGAKVVTELDAYAEQYDIPLFDRSVDFGWFYFMTKPIFFVLLWLKGLIGNFGLAILALTVIIKLLFFPLANKSYKAMSKMRKLAPEMKEMRERYKDDKPKMQQELMAMYKKEKVNPASGCLPILVQIPVFFALYKVLFVTIEMRHAPFYGWIEDLSAPDPTVIWNLFGLLPFDPSQFLPAFLLIGAWPLLMSCTMWLQQKISPQPPDPMQAKIFLFMPLIFLFIFATFPAGLVIYWTWNNLLSVGQQYFIMRKEGVT